MRIRVIRDQQEFFELRTRWDELLGNSHYNLPFYSWAWYWTWWKHFGDGSELFIAVGEDATGRLSLVAPLMKRRTKLRGFRVSEIRFMENGIGPRSSVLFCRSLPAIDVGSALIECLAEHSDEWDTVTLTNVQDSMPYIVAMRGLLAERAIHIIEEPGEIAIYRTRGRF